MNTDQGTAAIRVDPCAQYIHVRMVVRDNPKHPQTLVVSDAARFEERHRICCENERFENERGY